MSFLGDELEKRSLRERQKWMRVGVIMKIEAILTRLSIMKLPNNLCTQREIHITKLVRLTTKRMNRRTKNKRTKTKLITITGVEMELEVEVNTEKVAQQPNLAAESSDIRFLGSIYLKNKMLICAAEL